MSQHTASPHRLLLVGNTQVILCEPERKAYSLALGEKSSLALSHQLLTWKPAAPIATDWQPTFIPEGRDSHQGATKQPAEDKREIEKSVILTTAGPAGGAGDTHSGQWWEMLRFLVLFRLWSQGVLLLAATGIFRALLILQCLMHRGDGVPSPTLAHS